MQEIWVRSLGWEVLLEKEMATYSSILPWRIPWREEPGGLQVTESQRVRHFWGTNTYTFFLFLFKSTSISIREGIDNPLQYSCLENPMDGGAWWATVHGVAKSRTWLMRLSSSNISMTSLYVMEARNKLGIVKADYKNKDSSLSILKRKLYSWLLNSHLAQRKSA